MPFHFDKAELAKEGGFLANRSWAPGEISHQAREWSLAAPPASSPRPREQEEDRGGHLSSARHKLALKPSSDATMRPPPLWRPPGSAKEPSMRARLCRPNPGFQAHQAPNPARPPFTEQQQLDLARRPSRHPPGGFRSIILLRSTTALSSALSVQPIVPGAKAGAAPSKSGALPRNAGEFFLSGCRRSNSWRRPLPYLLPEAGRAALSAEGRTLRSFSTVRLCSPCPLGAPWTRFLGSPEQLPAASCSGRRAALNPARRASARRHVPAPAAPPAAPRPLPERAPARTSPRTSPPRMGARTHAAADPGAAQPARPATRAPVGSAPGKAAKEPQTSREFLPGFLLESVFLPIYSPRDVCGPAPWGAGGLLKLETEKKTSPGRLSMPSSGGRARVSKCKPVLAGLHGGGR